MARLSKTGGKTSKAKARKASPAKGRKTTKTKRRVAPKPRKGRSVAELEAQLELRTRELDQALEQQKATAEVLQVISNSSGDLPRVFDTMLDKAMHLCGAEFGVLGIYDGKTFQTAATRGLPEKYAAYRARSTGDYGPGTAPFRHLQGEPLVHIVDLIDSDAYRAGEPNRRALVDIGGARCLLCVPLLNDRRVIGCVMIFRQEARPFSDQQIALLEYFAAQAVIAIENARLFNEVQERTNDLSESLQQQTATAEVLQAISRSTFDLDTILQTLVKTAARLCNAGPAQIFRREGNVYRYAASQILKPAYREIEERIEIRAGRGTLVGRMAMEKRPVQIPDAWSDPEYEDKDAAQIGNVRSMLAVPLLRDGEPIGAFALARSHVEPFTESQIKLVTTFADQAVIAIENVRLFNETREALERQTATADILKVIASSPDDVQPVFEAIAERSKRLVDALSTTVFRLVDGVMHLRAFTPTNPEADATLQAMFPVPLSAFSWGESIRRGEIYRVVDTEHELEGLRDLARLRGFRSMLFIPLLRDREPIGLISVTRLEPGPFADHHVQLLQTFADQAVIAISNVGLFKEVQERTRELSASLDDLRTAQDRLVQTEKLASLGQLTAGIAHEIKNPLNFVNNFSSLSAELIDELDEALAPVALDQKTRLDVGELTAMLKSNLEKVVQHGKRADSIVKNMLLHSREGSGELRVADINALVEESLNLAYHGARAEKPGFNITLKRDLDPEVGAVELYPQEITRALLNLISNGFYAATKRRSEAGDETFEPELSAATKNLGKSVEIRIRDNGTGIPLEVKEKMFNPFFTTKPAGEGTGLGLSMSHDIVVKQHGGRIDVETEPGVFTEFIITLPRTTTGQAITGGTN
jgi:two-component system NtrC family sensor kinase